MSDTSTPRPVCAGQIADLAAWARTLTGAGTGADPAQRGAYLAAKAELLARVAAGARTTAEQATALHPFCDKETQ